MRYLVELVRGYCSMKQVPVVISLESSLFRVIKQTKWVWSNGEQIKKDLSHGNFYDLKEGKSWRTVVVFWSIIINFTLVIFFLILSIDQTLGVYVYPPPLLTQLGQYVYPFIFTLQICLPLIFNVFSLLFVARVISLYIRFFLRLDNLSTFQYSPCRYMYHQHWSSPVRISSRSVMT